MKQKYHLPFHWLCLLLFFLPFLISCTGTEDAEISDNPSEGSTMPISFTALSKWEEAQTRLKEDANKTSFENGDQIGIFAYLNDSSTPNFMNNQQATCTQADGSSWSYTPVKYWPANPNDKLSFYAYYPYQENGENSIIKASSSASSPLSIEYNCPNADVDLMVAKAENQNHTTSSGSVPLSFQHLLARVKFTFTYEGEEAYHPVIHILKYTIPYYQGKLSAAFTKNDDSTTPSFHWEKIGENQDVVEIERKVTDVAGTVLHEKNQQINEFTAYLLPCSFPYSSEEKDKAGNFVISLNNKLYTYTPTSKITVEAGKSYTINFKIKKETTDSSNNYFITSYSIWKDGGTINGTLE